MKCSYTSAGVLATSLLYSACTSLSEQSVRVPAPFDSAVCFDVSLEGCASGLPHSVNSFRFADVYGSAQESYPVGSAPAPGGQYPIPRMTCLYRKITYKPVLDTKTPASIVFFSPSLFNQVADAFAALNRARDSCKRLLDVYKFQASLVDQQIEQATNQTTAQSVSAIIEHESLNNSKIGSGAIPPDIAASAGTGFDTAIHSVDALKKARDTNTKDSSILNQRLRDRSFKVDYQRQFQDLQEVIDAQAEQVNRAMAVLDRSAMQLDSPAIVRRYYRSGSWVQQGSTVAELKMAK